MVALPQALSSAKFAPAVGLALSARRATRHSVRPSRIGGSLPQHHFMQRSILMAIFAPLCFAGFSAMASISCRSRERP